MTFVEFRKNFLLVCFIFVAARVNFLKIVGNSQKRLQMINKNSHRNQTIKIGIRSEGALGNQFFAACRALFVSTSQSRNDAVAAKAVKTLLCSHRFLEHIEANGTPNEIKSLISFGVAIDFFLFTSIHCAENEAKRQFLCYRLSLPAVFDATHKGKDPKFCFEFVAPLYSRLFFTKIGVFLFRQNFELAKLLDVGGNNEKCLFSLAVDLKINYRSLSNYLLSN